MHHWLRAGAIAASATPKGVRKTIWCKRHQRPAPEGGTRFVRYHVRVPGLTAVSQVIDSRKASTYCFFAKMGSSVK